MSFKIKWLGQGGFIFELGAKILCVDPYLSNSVEKAEGLVRLPPIPVKPEDLKADMIVTTHNHMDHLDKDTLMYTDKQNILFSGPSSCMEELKKLGFPGERLIELNNDQSVKLGETLIHAVYAEHTKDSIGVVIFHDGISIYLVGDSRYNDKLLGAARFKPDILVCCINGKLGNMDFNDAAKLAWELGVKVAIPCHYGMFAKNTEDPLNYKTALQKYNIKYREMEFNKLYDVNEILG